MSLDQYSPQTTEFISVGVCGVLLYTVIFVIAASSLFRYGKAHKTNGFHFAIACMAVCELPRFIALAISGQYNCLICYSFHIIADVLYFVSLALVIRTFANILEMGPYVSFVYSKNGLSIAVILQFAVDLCAYVGCLTAPSLTDFFRTKLFEFFTSFDMLQNVFYAATLALNGCALISR